MARTYVLETDQWLPRPVHEVFDYFADAGNLQELTPPWLDFHIETPLPLQMRAGTSIDYRLRLHGVRLRWRTVIAVWERGRRFVDEQVHGPYRRWVHTHTFEAERGGTRVRDRVEYEVPGGALVHALFVRRDVRRIFAYRASRLAERFGAEDAGCQMLGTARKAA